MRKFIISSTLSVTLAASTTAAVPALKGFDYGNAGAPVGNEWESPELLAYNKQQPRAYFFSFASVENARKVLPENSIYYQSLNGDWKFNWVNTPEKRPKEFYRSDYDVSEWDNIAVPGCWNVQGILPDGSMKYGVPVYVNQPVIFQHKVAVDDWRGGVMRTPPEHWTTYKDRNEVGSYRRTFTIPDNWNGREIYINFDGVDSFFYLWINGSYIGFSKNSRNTATFDITDFVVKGENSVAVEVYRSSDGSFLEAQDMFRLPGIIRDTYLTSTPKVAISDLAVRTLSIAPDGEAKISVDISVENLTKKDARGYSVTYSFYPCELYSDMTSSTPAMVQSLPSKVLDIVKSSTTENNLSFYWNDPKKWSAEEPWRYVMVAELKNSKGKTVDIASTYMGVRTVEILDTPASQDEFGLAGRYFYVNTKPVKLKGVNRHETNPLTGHAITRDQMEQEVMLMKRGNINHVRNSHYSNAPYWYYVCDKYGIYLEDEANIESHEYYYGNASLSHPKEWKAAHVARNMELVRAHVNSPAIVIWSLGNEGGPGDNYLAAYNAIKQFDTSRPIQYERNNNIVDMGSNQYPSVAWVRETVKGKAEVKYPYHISEYAHSMGNAVGNLIDYWEAIESTNFFCGGAIWDWVDQALLTHTSDGKAYMAYGGDFGDTPNDGMFCMNGIMLPDLSPKPQYFEVQKVYQNVGVKASDMNRGEIEVFNKNYFTPLDYDMRWKLHADGKEVASGNRFGGTAAKDIAPRTTGKMTIPFDMNNLDADKEYFLIIEFLQPADRPWAEKGFVQMREQLPVKSATPYAPIVSGAGKSVKINESAEGITVSGDGFKIVFDDGTGSIYTLNYNGKDYITPGNGPRLDAYRAPVDNDVWVYSQWYAAGLDNLKHKASDRKTFTRPDGSVVISYKVESQAPSETRLDDKFTSGRARLIAGDNLDDNALRFITNQIWTVYPDGSVELEAAVTDNKPAMTLPRLGYAMKLPSYLENYTYYGRGPVNNFNDRKTGQFVGLYDSKVADMFVGFPKPQSMSNREEVRWSSLRDNDGNGLQFIALDTMSMSVLPWSEKQLANAPHPCDLPASDGNWLHLDTKVTGLGGSSCGQGGPLSHDRVKGGNHHFGFIIRPITSSVDAPANARVGRGGVLPLSIVRNNKGEVSISSADPDARIIYTDGTTKGRKKTPVEKSYSTPFEFKTGGTIIAWNESMPLATVTMTFEPHDVVPMEVVYCSSEEPGENASFITDGNPSTIWHTAYGVTVAKYPHWIDFDTYSIKGMKGFSILPRQDSTNGNIKDYRIEVSDDGKIWKKVTEGSFDASAKEKKVIFDTPVKARYMRFTALSSQRGNDYASAAEFSIIPE